MRYVLPTTPNVCSYTTLAKMNCQISTHLTFVLDPDVVCLRECRWRTICALTLTVLYKLSSFVSVTGIILQLSEFHVDCVNDCVCCIGCVVCYNVEELRSRYDAKLQHVLLTFSSGVFLQKCQNLAGDQKKLCGNKTSISC